jgi:hypothetical protein
MNAASICREWKTAFPHAAPAGFLCRVAASERWVRTHSLPGSKRYPDTTSEYAEVLYRYRQIASEVLGEGSHCVLFASRFGDERHWDVPADGPLRGHRFAHVMTEGDGDGDGDGGERRQFFAAETTWRASAFDELLTAVADDQCAHLLFFNPQRRTAFAPYDGGADIFVATREDALAAKNRFEAWLSARPDRL